MIVYVGAVLFAVIQYRYEYVAGARRNETNLGERQPNQAASLRRIPDITQG